MILDELRDVAKRLAEADSATLGTREAIPELHRILASMEASVTKATAAFDASKEWDLDRAQNVTQWLTGRCRLPKTTARRRVRLGRKLRHLPECDRAWLAGEITDDHVAVIGAVRRKETEEALARDEKMLVDNARQLRFDKFAASVKSWEQRVDPEGTDDKDFERRQRRNVYLTETVFGMFLGQMTLDPISGTQVHSELERLTKIEFQKDWKEAKDRLGRDPTIADLKRTPAQRRADALLEMAIRSRTAPKDGQRPAPLITVHVGYETMHGPLCEIAGASVISPSSLIPLLDGAYIERAVFKPNARVECSELSRFFTGATRRAIDLRDRECSEELCDVPADRCEADHILDFTKGGRTTQENGQLQCRYHNLLKYRRPPP